MSNRKLITLSQILPDMTPEQISTYLAIEDVCDGDVIYSIMLQYMYRYMFVVGETKALQTAYFFKMYGNWLLYRGYDIKRAIEALYAEFDPTTDYRLNESEIKLENDGDKTTTTKNKYDYSVEDSAGSGAEAPTYSSYTTTFDSTAERLESKRIESGKRTTRTQATNDELNKKTTTVSHQTASLTDGDTTYSADYIHSLKKIKEGNIHRSPAEIAKETIDLYRNSLLHEFISEFMNRYTFFAGNAFEGEMSFEY